jgi:PAS domain-containing protein
MAQQPLELILAKQLAAHLASPVFLVDPDGALLFYNEPAEALLGLRYEETGAMPLAEWGTVFTPSDEGRNPLPPDDLPLAVALRDRRPAYGELWIHGLDGIDRRIAVVAMPLEGHGGRHLGAIALFSEVQP